MQSTNHNGNRKSRLARWVAIGVAGLMVIGIIATFIISFSY
ncbi:hypothetical protein ACQRBK_07880 [Peptoniphilaceae bacterium SGI.137]|nr:hypothetical protein [Peptoniphilaceae bacterium]MDY3987587.1 hypothetical protein [Peptoniphilaceae bacterium]MDY4196213.1 hypothetical protein [Peptoniphilaceae bacterium]MDY5766680.1 hypothetical protein [Peptoniphilaceae bacterium]MDY5842419.1 hypothetical protein [Peptoniphilaceae bacterium]